MTPNPHPPDALDRAFGDFFQAQMPHPWPAAPATPAARPATRPAVPDGSARARWTLAASVALLVGGGWLLSGGPQPSRPSAGKTAAGPDILNEASATLPDAFKSPPKSVPAKGTPAAEPFKLP